MAGALSADTKDALARETPQALHCRDALAHALALYGSGSSNTTFATQRNAVARLFWSLLHDRKAHPIRKVAGTRLYRTPVYQIQIPAGLAGFPAKPLHKCDRIMEVRAAFLACGSLSAATHGYHLEFVLPSDAHAERLSWMLRAIASEPKRNVRKSHAVLYYKDFEAIAQVLSTVGAFGALLHLEDIRALKETKNRIHRLVNTEAANVERAAIAAAAQRQVINYLAETQGLRSLSPALREIAHLRIKHPEESLAELGARCNPPASKSAVNSRLATLARLAAGLRAGTSQGQRSRLR